MRLHKPPLPDTCAIHSRAPIGPHPALSVEYPPLTGTWLHRESEIFMSDNMPPQVPSRRRFIGVAAATLAAGSLSRLAFAETDQAITQVTESTGSGKTAIRSLRVHAPESQL